MDAVCVFHWLGRVAYDDAWQLQNSLAAEIGAGQRPPTLLLLEHPHTFTFGRRGRAENLLWDEAELARRGVSVRWVDRGGDVTYHGPGQLVGYPLLPLGTSGLQVHPERDSARIPQADYVGYVRRLEQALILALFRMGVRARQVTGLTGVWVDPPASAAGQEQAPPAKIAAIGVKVDARGITRHGFALNIQPDMSYWQGIIGCGLVGYAVTSLAEICSPPPPMERVVHEVVRAFGETFGYQMVEEVLANRS
jgi:lipoate-protein ligase B